MTFPELVRSFLQKFPFLSPGEAVQSFLPALLCELNNTLGSKQKGLDQVVLRHDYYRDGFNSHTIPNQFYVS